MSAKIIGTCSLCNGPVTLVTIVDPWLGNSLPIPTCQRCGATKKDPYGPVIEMTPYKGLPGTIQPSPIDWKLGNPTCDNPFAGCVVALENPKYSIVDMQKAVKQLKEESKWSQK